MTSSDERAWTGPGCTRCFGENASIVWNAKPWVDVAVVAQDSHFSLKIVACSDCCQRFARVYTDFEDAMHVDLFPVSPEIADDLVASGTAISTARLEALGSPQRRLQVDYLSDSRDVVRWNSGTWLIWR